MAGWLLTLALALTHPAAAQVEQGAPAGSPQEICYDSQLTPANATFNYTVAAGSTSTIFSFLASLDALSVSGAQQAYERLPRCM